MEQTNHHSITTELSQTIAWVTLPLQKIGRQVNTWVLFNPETEHATIVDCGIHGEETKKAWRQAWEQLKNPAVNSIVVTHYHPDHGGEVLWLTEQLHAPLHTSPGEFFCAHCWKNQIGPFSIQAFRQLLVYCGNTPSQGVASVDGSLEDQEIGRAHV